MANFTTKTIKEIFDAFISKYTVLKSKYGDSSPILKNHLLTQSVIQSAVLRRLYGS